MFSLTWIWVSIGIELPELEPDLNPDLHVDQLIVEGFLERLTLKYVIKS